ncbi:hypothetical protein KEM55_001806 [Ascosphaera atra]|nr:hypothetical protein KEM55_001806 [Ascosphaera atra]
MSIAHVIGKRANPVDEWIQMGFLGKDFNLNSAANLVYLCSFCHGQFDESYPELLLLPRDLQLYIDHEKRDYQERSRAAAKGLIVRRTTPPNHNVLFEAIHLVSGHDCQEFPKPFPGNAVAAILKAIQGALTLRLSQEDGVQRMRISMHKRCQLAELISLWERPDPVIPGDKKQPTPSPQHTQPPSASLKGEERPTLGPNLSAEDNAAAYVKALKAYGNYKYYNGEKEEEDNDVSC